MKKPQSSGRDSQKACLHEEINEPPVHAALFNQLLLFPLSLVTRIVPSRTTSLPVCLIYSASL
ncbi:hypothetical protein Csa_009040 [Cucumis sativus]|uniref:Uncharacterized protein n=1 Tax=Cucumis sativus TaxID=3659 RepID=A0A0A0KPT9_CUCSA|nr:hypothetical protein Csa_009040 [Cucumis sativus]